MGVPHSRWLKVKVHSEGSLWLWESPLSFALLSQKDRPKATWGKIKIYCLTGHTPSLKEAREEIEAGSWRQELKQRTRRNTASWLAPHGLLSLLSYTQDYYPRSGTTHSGLGSITSILVCVCIMVYLWRSEDNLWELVFSFYYVEPRNLT